MALSNHSDPVLKSNSPFYPGQPVPVELFVGRREQVERIMIRGVGQVANGKPVTMYIQGQYGIGKSSIAKLALEVAERQYGLHGIYVSLAGAQTLDDVARLVLEATILAEVSENSRKEGLHQHFQRYINKIEAFGLSVTINQETLRQDAASLTSPAAMLHFLSEVRGRLPEARAKGVFLVLDEINGITRHPDFAYYIKGLVDTNAMRNQPLPLLLMLCGVEERRRELIQKHQPVDRIFDVIEIAALNKTEMESFFTRAFYSVNETVLPEAMRMLTHYSAGYPKIMHVLGDAAYWADRDDMIDNYDAMDALFVAADDIGKKYVDQQVLRALQSNDYRSILAKIAMMDPTDLTFTRSDVVSDLTGSERKKFNNFQQKMKSLNAIRSLDMRGEYAFTLPMVRFYIWLNGIREQQRSTGERRTLQRLADGQ